MAKREDERIVVVVAKDLIAEETVALELETPDRADLPTWEPGAHIDLHLPNGAVRQYSLCGCPTERAVWRVAVLREPQSRGGSDYIHTDLHTGASLRVGGPRNHFRLADADRYLFIAGGIGVTPLVPMVAEVSAAGADWGLLYGGRRRSSMAFRDKFATHGDRVLIRPEDEFGLLDLDHFLGVPEAGTLIYCCGPTPLIAAVEARCASWSPGSLRVERFTGTSQELDPDIKMLERFEIVLDRSGLTLAVGPDQSILDVCLDAGIDVLNTCREGTCGTCEVTVLEGVPDHRDSVLTPDERASGEFLLACVSRSQTERLVLDL
jgi:ferredoxin-NADP reductase